MEMDLLAHSCKNNLDSTKSSVRPVILCFTDFYLPGFKGGGPIKSIQNFVDKFSSEFDILIVTRDRDLGCNASFSGVLVDQWNFLGGAKVFYLNSKFLNFSIIHELLKSTSHDVLYLNSFFSFKFSILPILINRYLLRDFKTPILLAPRGQFSTGALKFKVYKKRFFIFLIDFFNIYRRVNWQATSLSEKIDILNCLSRIDTNTIFIANNLPKIYSKNTNTINSVKNNFLSVCFMSRISRKKNLDYVLKVLSISGIKARLTIYGPIEDPIYWGECQQLINRLPRNIAAIYKGALDPDLVIEKLSEHDLFFFPTHGENFGHVIYEALCSGLPVLTSDATPWNFIENDGIGWCIPLSYPHIFACKIKELAALSPNKLIELKRRVQNFSVSYASNCDAENSNRELFNSLIYSSPK